jgi:hypothetical protein
MVNLFYSVIVGPNYLRQFNLSTTVDIIPNLFYKSF